MPAENTDVQILPPRFSDPDGYEGRAHYRKRDKDQILVEYDDARGEVWFVGSRVALDCGHPPTPGIVPYARLNGHTRCVSCVEKEEIARFKIDTLIERRTACLILDHDVRHNRGIVARAIREVIGREAHHTDPHFIDYAPARSEGSCSGDPAYRLDLTDAEFADLCHAIDRMGGRVDAYHD